MLLGDIDAFSYNTRTSENRTSQTFGTHLYRPAAEIVTINKLRAGIALQKYIKVIESTWKDTGGCPEVIIGMTRKSEQLPSALAKCFKHELMLEVRWI